MADKTKTVTSLYRIELKLWLAKKNNIPEIAEGIIERETPKAIFFRILKNNFKGWLPKGHISLKKIGEIEIKKEESKSTPKTASLIKDQIIVKFDYDAELVAQIKTLSGRKWDPAYKCWRIPVSFEALDKLKKLNFQFDNNMNKELAKLAPKKDLDIKIPIKGLKPFQIEGVKFIESRNGRALIGDEMGSGKTAQALGYLALHPEKQPVVIVVPASLKLNWKKEVKLWTPSRKATILNGRHQVGAKLEKLENKLSRATKTLSSYKESKKITSDKTEIKDLNKKIEKVTRAITKTQKEIDILIADITDEAYKLAKSDILIINYDILSSWKYVLTAIKPQVLIADEAHFAKNRGTKRTKALMEIGKTCPHILALSGTPIVNRPVEFFNILNLVQPKVFNNFWAYAKKYCDAKKTRFGWDFSGSSNTEELHSILTKTLMIRRLKKDILSELPDKIYSCVPMEYDHAIYQVALNKFKEWLKGTWTDKSGTVRSNSENPAAAMVEIEKVKQGITDGKIPYVLNWIEDFLNSNGKLVVMAVHKKVIKTIYNKFKSIAVKVDGSVSQEERQEAVEKFQNDPETRLFVGNIKAAGVGLTLTAASDIAFVELPWAPGDLVQAEDRCHRIGQKSCVNVYYLLAHNTIEEDIAKLIDNKREILSQVLDGEDVENKTLISSLINKIKEGEIK